MATFDARATATPLDQATLANVRRELDAGNKIAAIKVVREASGLGLAEAKAMVEAIESGVSTATTSIDLTEAEGERIKALLLAGDQAEAIKLLRDASQSRVDLKTARGLIQTYLKHLTEAGGAAKAETHFTVDAGLSRDATIERASGGPLTSILKLAVAAAIALGFVVWMFGWPPNF
ncbi:MAG: ribosomal protein L7/L12 [Rhodospirillales bacterium]|nr:ribosomal protein L7/L12 [Rhodospirillales bacterium]